MDLLHNLFMACLLPWMICHGKVIGGKLPTGSKSNVIDKRLPHDTISKIEFDWEATNRIYF